MCDPPVFLTHCFSIHTCNITLYSPDIGECEDTPKAAAFDYGIAPIAGTMQLLQAYQVRQEAAQLHFRPYDQVPAFCSLKLMEKPCTQTV